MRNNKSSLSGLMVNRSGLRTLRSARPVQYNSKIYSIMRTVITGYNEISIFSVFLYLSLGVRCKPFFRRGDIYTVFQVRSTVPSAAVDFRPRDFCHARGLTSG